MKFLLSLLLVASTAFGAEPVRTTVSVKGETYSLGYLPHKIVNPPHLFISATAIPLEYDAVAAGKATPVKGDGQGSCGDCWAWARTSSLEAAMLSAGQGLTLSEEDTTDNASDEFGCNGGMMDFNYEISHGVSLLSTCPWEGGGASCASVPVAKGVSMAFVGGSSGPTDADLMTAIYQFGSVAVTVAAGDGFDVSTGTDRMLDCGTTGIDHMVSLIGYRPAADGGVEYKMKNSWGQGWGAAGYAYIKQGCNQIASGDQSAMVITVGAMPPAPVPPTPSGWECQAKGVFGSTLYAGEGATKTVAGTAATAECMAAGHLFCRITSCSEVTR